MCRIGQQDRCTTTGCEWFKGFGKHCPIKSLKTSSPIFDRVPPPEPKLKLKRNTISHSKRWKIYERDNYACYLCKKPIEHTKQLTLDHVIPIIKGGRNYKSNLQTAHANCNQLKGDRLLKDLDMDIFKRVKN